MWGYLLVFLIAIFFMKTLDKKLDNKHEASNRQGQKITEYKGHYQAKYLLTKNEQAQYKKLKQYADANGLQICPKVRLLDIVEPRSGDPKYMAYMGKIKSKHVDFVICDQDLRIKGILELDDSSHDRADRQERDKFVDEILDDVGYTVIHTRYITENTLDPITKSSRKPSTDWPQWVKETIPWSEDKEKQKEIFEKWDNQCFEQAKLEAQQKPVYLTPEEQELAKQIRIERNGPTFEEWKAEKLRKEQEQKEHPEE